MFFGDGRLANLHRCLLRGVIGNDRLPDAHRSARAVENHFHNPYDPPSDQQVYDHGKDGRNFQHMPPAAGAPAKLAKGATNRSVTLYSRVANELAALTPINLNTARSANPASRRPSSSQISCVALKVAKRCSYSSSCDVVLTS